MARKESDGKIIKRTVTQGRWEDFVFPLTDGMMERVSILMESGARGGTRRLLSVKRETFEAVGPRAGAKDQGRM